VPPFVPHSTKQRHTCTPAGYENIVQVRALLEGVSVNEMLDHWCEILPAKMTEWRLERGELVELFGDTRDRWMAEDLQDWLSPNRIYEGVVKPIKASIASDAAEVYIVTTKQARSSSDVLCCVVLCCVGRKTGPIHEDCWICHLTRLRTVRERDGHRVLTFFSTQQLFATWRSDHDGNLMYSSVGK
jgi:hypothetical protein